MNCHLKSTNYALTIEIVLQPTQFVLGSCAGPVVVFTRRWTGQGERGGVSSERADSVIRTHWTDSILQQLCDAGFGVIRTHHISVIRTH